MERAVSRESWPPCITWLNPATIRAAASRLPRQYEFPTGYNTHFGAERFQVGEEFFFHSPQLVVGLA